MDNFEVEVLRASPEKSPESKNRTSSDALRMTVVENIVIRRRIRFTGTIAEGERTCLKWRMIIFWMEVVAAWLFLVWLGRVFRP